MDLLIQFDVVGIERISKRRSTNYITKAIYKNKGNIEKNDY